MDKKPYHHGNLEEALIEAGLSLVDREGLEGISLRRVAAACGVSHAAPYKHFKGKEELLTAMGRFVENRFAAVLEEAVSSPGEADPMMEMGKAYLRFFMENPHYFSFFQRRQEGIRVNLSDLAEAGNYKPYEVFKRGALRDLEPLGLEEGALQRTVVSMWAMVHGCTAISVMSGVWYDGSWEELLGSILKYNMCEGGNCGEG